MPHNTDKDIPKPRAVRTRKTGNMQKSKNTNQQPKLAPTTHSTPGNGSDSNVEEDENEIMARITKAKEELKELEAQKKALSKEIIEASAAAAAAAAPVAMIERPPRGVSIQEGMGLSNNKAKYDAIRRLVRDLVGEVGINWEVPWAEIPAAKKVKLYQAACDTAPFLKRFVQDWATQALAMQLLKNKRCHSYRRGYLEVPNKYAYLKDNAAKKKLQESHSTRATPQSDGEEKANNDGNSTDVSMVASGSTCSKSKRVAPVPVAAQQPRKKQKNSHTTKTRSTAKGKGKKKRGSVESEGEEEIQVDDKVNLVDLEE